MLPAAGPSWEREATHPAATKQNRAQTEQKKPGWEQSSSSLP